MRSDKGSVFRALLSRLVPHVHNRQNGRRVEHTDEFERQDARHCMHALVHWDRRNSHSCKNLASLFLCVVIFGSLRFFLGGLQRVVFAKTIVNISEDPVPRIHGVFGSEFHEGISSEYLFFPDSGS